MIRSEMKIVGNRLFPLSIHLKGREGVFHKDLHCGSECRPCSPEPLETYKACIYMGYPPGSRGGGESGEEAKEGPYQYAIRETLRAGG